MAGEVMSNKQRLEMGFAIAEVKKERARQHARFGEQNLPDGTGDLANHVEWLHSDVLPFKMAEKAQEECDAAIKDGGVTYAHLLAEEVFEAFAESDPEKLRAELVQVAAICVQWIECIDRRGVK